MNRLDLSQEYQHKISSIVHNFDHWSGRALPSPGEDNRGEGGGHGRARLEGGGQGLREEGLD